MDLPASERGAGVTPLELRYARHLLACFLFWVPTWPRLLRDIETEHEPVPDEEARG